MPPAEVERERDLEREYLIKAAMLVKIREQITWPEMPPLKRNRLTGKTKNEVQISVIGNNPFSPRAQEVFKLASNEHVHYVFQANAKLKEPFCHIVFIAEDQADDVDTILQRLGARPTLTVSDIPGFAQKGGCIEFFLYANRVIKLLVNEQAVLEKGLMCSREMYRGIAVKFVRKRH